MSFQTWIGPSVIPLEKKILVDPRIGDTDGTPLPVERIYCGDDFGMPRLVWERFPPVTLSAQAVAWNAIRLDWNDIGVDRGVIYVLHRWTGPNTFVEVYRGDALTYTDEGLSANTTYDYFIYASVNGGTVWDDEASATTPVRPIVSDDTGAMLCASSGTYAGPGADVGDWKLRATNYRLYTGYFDSTYASQHSGAIWNIPANVRNCISIDRVDVSFRVQHAPYAPDDWGLVMQFNTTWPGTWPSSSGQFRYLRCNGKDTWLGGTEWVTITSNNVPGYGTVAECFRTRNAQGIGLVANTTVSTYGYVNHATAPTIRPRLRIWYTRNA